MRPSNFEILTKAPRPDIVTEVLRSVTMRTVVFGRALLRAPFGVRVSFPRLAVFHIVLNGRCWVKIEGSERIRLNAGYTVIFPHADIHELTDHPSTSVRPIQELMREHPMQQDQWRYGGGGPETILLCGGFQLSDPKSNMLEVLLPRVVHIAAARDNTSAQLRSLRECMEAELEVSRPGEQAILSRLTEAFLLRATRDYVLSAGNGGTGLTATLLDPAIGRALHRIHQHPERPWTVAALAREAGLSRSFFAARFKQLLGDSPQHYLQRSRIGKAAQLLQSARPAIAEVAACVGYRSEFSFGRAFKRLTGEAPGVYRRRRISERTEG